MRIVDRLTLKRPQAYIRRDSKVPIKEIPGSAPPQYFAVQACHFRFKHSDATSGKWSD